MFSNPYQGIDIDIESILREMSDPSDGYSFTHRRRFARTLQVLKNNKPSGKLLELGAGGVTTLAIRELFPDLEIEVTNFSETEPTEHSYNPVAGRYYGEFRAFNIDLETVPIPVDDGRYDWVLCSEVIEHMEVDPMFLMSEINRVTKPKGWLLLTTPNVVSSRGIAKMLAGIEPYFYMQYRKKPSLYRHNYEYSIHSLMQVVRAAGFDGDIWTEDCFEDGMPGPIVRLQKAGFNIAHVGDNIFSLAKKTGPIRDRHPQAIYSD